MQAFRNFLYKFGAPGSNHPLALFHHCDLAVIHQMNELGNLMKTEPNNLSRRSLLIQRAKDAQHNLIDVLNYLVNTGIPDQKTPTEFRVKYPDDIQITHMNGTIWFGAECLAAGSRIANHEIESIELKPYAIRLSKAISTLRKALREETQQYDEETNQQVFFSEHIKELLLVFDKSWIEFEFKYIGVMCNIRTETQLFHQQEVAILFSEATQRALKLKYFDEEMVEMMDPTLMFAIPRLAIICGLVINTDGPLNPDREVKDMPACFRKYKELLSAIRELLSSISEQDLTKLEKALCTSDGLETLSDHLNHHSNDTQTDNEATLNSSQEQDTSLNSPSLLTQITIEPTIAASLLTNNVTGNQNKLHKLFLAISGVADQLQSNYPRDYRAIMKQAYTFCSSELNSETISEKMRRKEILDMPSDTFTFDLSLSSLINQQIFANEWANDSDSVNCHSCNDKFTFFRRKHHCRSCGQVVCGQCSPHYFPNNSTEEGSESWLRVCTACYIDTLGKLAKTLITRSNQSIIVH